MSAHETHTHDAPTTSGRTISWASLYDALVWLISFGRGRNVRQAILALAEINPGDKLLDVGCGTGDLGIAALAIAGPTGEVHGIDASPQMIAVARQKAARANLDIRFEVDVIESLSFPDDHFDIVTSTLMMHHLPNDLKRKGLAEMYRVTKPGGRILIVDIESSRGGSLGQRLSDLMIHLHGGHSAMQDNVQKLLPFVEDAGFTGTETQRIGRQYSAMTAQKTVSR